MERKHADQTGKKKRENSTEGKNDQKKLNCRNTRRSHGRKKANKIKKNRNAIHQLVDLGLPIFLVRAARNHRWPGLWVIGRPRRRRRRTYTALSNPSLYYLHRHDDTTRPWKTQRMLSRVYPSLGYLPSLDKLIRRPRPDQLRPTTDTHAWSHTHGLMEI